MPELTIEQITEKVTEKLRPLLLDEMNKAISEGFSKLQSQSPASTETPEIHHLKKHDPYCTTCGMPNLEFEPAKYRCKNCKRPLGNDEDIEKLEKCPHCNQESEAERTS